MGVINATPDSFSDGGRFLNASTAVECALDMVDRGADILDIGGESTRPGARAVSVAQELDRVIPVIEALRSRSSVAISIDTSKPEVMIAAVNAGASMINDVNGLRSEGAVDVVAQANVPVCIMHMQGEPQRMQANPSYKNVVAEVERFFVERIAVMAKAGIAENNTLIDPGIGFGKTLKHNLQLLNGVPQLRASTGCDVLIGVSRKSLIDELLVRTVDQRLSASLGLAVQSVLNGAKIVRVHDVRETYDAVRAAEAVRDS